MPNLINWELIKNPINWIMVLLMVMLGTLLVTYLMQSVKQS